MKTYGSTNSKSLKLSKDPQGIFTGTAMELRDLEYFVRGDAEMLWNA